MIVPVIAKLMVGESLYRGDLLAGAFLSGVLAVIGSYCGRFQLAYRGALFPLLALGSLVVTGMALSKEGFLNPFVMLAIIDTSRGESSEFASRFGAGDIALAMLLLTPVIPLIMQARHRLLLPRLPYARTAIAALFVTHIAAKAVHNTANAAQTNEPQTLSTALARVGQQATAYPTKYLPLQPYFALVSAVAMRWEIANIAKMATPLAGVETIEGSDAAGRTYVVVVGEALSRHHMHLYGYPRDTTPKLDRLAAEGDLIVFRDVVTSHAMTIPALNAAFRFRPGHGQDGHTLFDVLNGAGFKSYWISNQYQYGIYESAVSLLTSATSQLWLSQSLIGGVYEERRDFDSDVLPALRRVLAEERKDKFIFIHLMGSHDVYKARYPASDEYFTGPGEPGCRSAAQAQTSNEYDNSVRFNDSIVHQIVHAVRGTTGGGSGGETFILYFSDHGEEVYDFRDFAGHTDSMLSPYLAEVPFMLWLSNSYKRHHPEFAAHAAASGDRSYVTSDLLYSITDLARLSFSGMDPTRSVFSRSFVARTRMTADRDYDSFARAWAPDVPHARPAPLIKCEGARMSERRDRRSSESLPLRGGH
jgi:glucan phosphoethanolaminetransferase (alkaline phosphatase superfamily)